MSVSIKKIQGIESVNVSLNRGLASIRLKPGNTVALKQVRKAIEDNAFTPKDAQVVAVGELVPQDGKLQFKVAGTNESFPVASIPHASWQKEVGHNLTFEGLISAPGRRGESGTLEITGVSGRSPTTK